MQPSEPHDAPLVPEAPTTETPAVFTDGGDRPDRPPFDRPPRTEYATEAERDTETIAPGVADLR